MTSCGFIYFFPGHDTSVTTAQLDAVGLGYAFDSPPDRTGGAGPDGATGVLLGQPGAFGTGSDHPLAYLPDRQAWRYAAGRDYAMGHYTDAVPAAAALARRRMIDGPAVRLSDGHDYVVPVARSLEDVAGQLATACRLPQQLTLNDEDEWVYGAVETHYADLWALAQRWWDHVTMAAAHRDDSGDVCETGMSLSAALDGAVTALAVNYRLSRYEVAMLGLLTTERYVAVLNAVIDWEAVVTLLKKKEGAGT